MEYYVMIVHLQITVIHQSHWIGAKCSSAVLKSRPIDQPCPPHSRTATDISIYVTWTQRAPY